MTCERAEPKGNEGNTGPKRGKSEAEAEKETRRFSSERQTCPRKRKGTRSALLGSGQTESRGKAFWDAKELDRDLSRGESRPVASEPFFPAETILGPLSTGKRWRRPGESGLCRLYLDLHPLVAQELDASLPMFPSTPITPQERRGTDYHGMHQHADLPWLCRGGATPLTLLAQRTGPTTPNAGGIHQPQAAIGFLAPFVNRKFLMSRTVQRAIGLEGEVLPREAAHLKRGCNGGLAIPASARLLVGFGHRRSKQGGADR